MQCRYWFFRLIFPFRICDAALEGRFHVWLPVPEWVQSCADPEMHRDTQEVACDYRNGRMQSGKEPDPGGGGEGMALSQVGLHLFLLTSSNLQTLLCLQPHLLSSHCMGKLIVSADRQHFCWLFSPAILELQAMPFSRSHWSSCHKEVKGPFSVVSSERLGTDWLPQREVPLPFLVVSYPLVICRAELTRSLLEGSVSDSADTSQVVRVKVLSVSMASALSHHEQGWVSGRS